MKRSLLMLFVVLGWAFMAPVTALAQWHKVVVPPALYGRPDFSGINFVNQDTGWTVGFARQMYKSTNSGRSWEVQPYPPTNPTHFFGVYFDTPQEGWVFGSGFYHPGPGTIIHTTDGGTTWVEQSNPHPNNTLFAGARVGNEIWLVGDNDENSGSKAVLLRSTDLGETWVSVEMPQFKGILNINVISQDNVWLTGVSGTLIQTTDSGRTFIDRSIPESQINFRKVYFGLTEGYATGNPAIPGVYISKFYATTNGGVSWTLRHTWGSEMEAMGMALLNNVIYVSGGDFSYQFYDVGRILASTDGGFTWTEVARDTAHFSTLRTDIVQTDAQHAWVAGQNVFYYQPNSAPVVSEIPNDTAYVGAQWAYQVQATDAEGDTLKYRLLVNPAWLAIDSLSGTMSGTPSLADTGASQVTVAVADGVFGNEVAASFVLAVTDTSTPPVNMPPYFVTHMPDTVDVRPDSSYLWYFIVADPNPRDTLESESGPIGAPGFFVLPNSQPAIDTLFVTVDGKPFASDTGQVFLAHVVAYDQGGLTDTLWFYIRVKNITSVRELPGLPTEYRLDQNYPNPFNPVTVIRYDIPYSAAVRLTVYNLLGQEIAVLVSERQTPGIYEADFQASNLPSGTYLYRLTAGQYTLTKKMLLLK